MDGQGIKLKGSEERCQHNLDCRVCHNDVVPGGDQTTNDPQELDRSCETKQEHPTHDDWSSGLVSWSQSIHDQSNKCQVLKTDKVHQKTGSLEVCRSEKESWINGIKVRAEVMGKYQWPQASKS